MLIKINIIPENEKKERLLKKKIEAILQFGTEITLILIVFLIILLTLRVVLDIEHKAVKMELAEKNSKTDKSIEETEKLLNSASAISQKVNKTSSEMNSWFDFFKRLSGIYPDGVKATSIHIEQQHVKISGFSKRREDFLKFLENLEKENIKNVVSPVSNLVAPENFDFDIEFDIGKEIKK